MEFGRNMLGVMDETGQLKYGQVYVQYTSMKTSNLLTLTGEMKLIHPRNWVDIFDDNF